jgi:amino acid transporter
VPSDLLEDEPRLKQAFRLRDLVPLSVSSVGPMFSVAATGGVMAADAGWWTLPAIAILAVPFIISSFVFRLLNRHFPSSGASYHWSARIIGRTVSRYQAWILILAYFLSIPPIAIPAGAYTLALIAPGYHAPAVVQLAVTLFWILFAAVPLLLGARPTARITQVFFAVEMVALAAFGVVGALNWHRLAVPIHFGAPPIGGILIVAVVAATILDGWEIDSYAAEESRKPRDQPGIGGIIGAFGALLFYAILFPLMLGETPLSSLAGSVDPLAVWSHRLVPGAPWLMLIPILLSTAGGLWLTSYILTRALFAMGRERLIPAGFGRLNRHHVPHVAIVVTLDSLTGAVFLTVGHRKLPDVQINPHSHRLLLAGSLFSTVVMGALLVAFFFYGPKAIGGGVDQTFAVLLALGAVFAWATRKRAAPTYVFTGTDIVDLPQDFRQPPIFVDAGPTGAAVSDPEISDLTAYFGTPGRS